MSGNKPSDTDPTTTPVKTEKNADAAAPVPAVLPHQEVLALPESPDNGIRLQQLYWRQLVQGSVKNLGQHACLPVSG